MSGENGADSEPVVQEALARLRRRPAEQQLGALPVAGDDPDELGSWGPPVIIRADDNALTGEEYLVRRRPEEAMLVPVPGGHSQTRVLPSPSREAADALGNLFRELAEACGVKWDDKHRLRVEDCVAAIVVAALEAAVPPPGHEDNHWH